MDRKPIDSKRQAGGRGASREGGATGTGAARRIDRLAEVVDRCTEAREIAEALDEKLLSYLLAMAIQETRAAMRQEVSTAAGTVAKAPSRPATPRRVKDDG